MEVRLFIRDKSKSKIKGNSEEARSVNGYMDTVKAKIVQTYQELELENKLITPRASLASERWKRNLRQFSNNC